MRAVRLPPDQRPRLFAEILGALPEFWGERDVLALHQPVWLRQFAGDTFIVREDEVLLGYLLGVVTAHRLAYVHAVATRLHARHRGVGSALYTSFVDHARTAGAARVEAITTPTNTDSVAFHRRLGFAVDTVNDYAGAGQTRVLFSSDLASSHISTTDRFLQKAVLQRQSQQSRTEQRTLAFDDQRDDRG